MPAGAEFTFDIGGGLRARVAIASLEGRVGLDARLGIEAEARAGVCVHWNRADGLTLGALIEAEAQPRLDVGLNASVTGKISRCLGRFPIPEQDLGPVAEGTRLLRPCARGRRRPARRAGARSRCLDFDISDIEITKKPELDVGGMMLDAFTSLVG